MEVPETGGVTMMTTNIGGCPNAANNPLRHYEAPDEHPPYVVPDVTFRRGEFILQYKDRRPGRPPLMGRMDPGEDDEANAEDGRLSQLTLRLVPFDEDAIKYDDHYMPKIPLPTEMIMANDVTDGGQMPNLTEDETIACLLNAYNVRHYVHKRAQVSSEGGLFVIAIEYDVRQSGERIPYGEKPVNEAALTLTVTLRSDGLEPGFPNVHRKYYLYFSDATNEEAPPEISFEPAEEWVGHSMARPMWATVRGLLPLGIDFILGHPYYSAIIRKAKNMGKKVEVKLYDTSPVFNDRGEANTTDLSVTRMMCYIQGVCQGEEDGGYGYRFNLCRLPDGYTGQEVDKDPESTVATMRRLEEEGKFVGQPLLVTDEEKCMPKETHPMEYFRLELENFNIEWGRDDVQTFGRSY